MKVYCESCGAEMEIAESQIGTGVTCVRCRTVFVATPDGATSAGNPVADMIAGAAGLDAVRGFSWSALFSEVFKSHSEDELEAYWAAGCAGNIPALDRISTGWPRPWMFVRVFLLSLMVYGMLYFAWHQWHNMNLIPALILVGSFAVPLLLVIFFFEMNVRRNVSLYLTLKTFLVGGVLGVLCSLIMFRFTEGVGLDWMGASVAGIAEESGKLLAVLLFVHTLRYPYILNGLLFGASVGAGFAAFESAGYAMKVFLIRIVAFSVDNAEKIIGSVTASGDAGNALNAITSKLTEIGAGPMFEVIFTRAWLTGLCGHVLWTGMSAGALWMVKGDRKFEWGMLLDIRFVRVFLIAVVCHMIWNSPWNPEWITAYDKFILLGVIGWSVIFAMIQSGLNQLRAEKLRCAGDPGTEPSVAAVVRTQMCYVEALRRPAAPLPRSPRPEPGRDHLNIQSDVDASREREERREAPSFSERAWQKYYRKDR